MPDSRTPDRSWNFKQLKKDIVGIGTIAVALIGRKQDEVQREPNRFGYRCPCGLCGETLDTSKEASASAARHYGGWAIYGTRHQPANVKFVRSQATLAAHWARKAHGIK